MTRRGMFDYAYWLLRPDSSFPYIITNYDDVVSALVSKFGVPRCVADYEVWRAVVLYRSLLCVKCRYSFKKGRRPRFSLSDVIFSSGEESDGE